MNNEKSMFEKPFCEKRFVNVSICESNIKSKKGTYYGRICKMGHLTTKQVLQIAKDRSPHLNIPIIESALETIADVILDMAGQGYTVEFSNLGSFSLSTIGKIEMSGEGALQNSIQNSIQITDEINTDSSEDSIENLIDELQEDRTMSGNYDVSEQVKGGVHFAFKFSPSKTLKASMKNIKMNLAIKKKHAPIIKKVEDALPERTASSHATSQLPTVIKVSGHELKIVGDDQKVGIYLEEKPDEENNSSYMIKNYTSPIVKVPSSSLIQNENQTLTFLLDGQLKAGKKYCITIVTQGVSGGKLGKNIKFTKAEFIWKSTIISENIRRLQDFYYS